MDLLAGYGEDASSDEEDDSKVVPLVKLRAESLDLGDRIKGVADGSKADSDSVLIDEHVATDGIDQSDGERMAGYLESVSPAPFVCWNSARLDALFPAPTGDSKSFRARLKRTIDDGSDITNTIMSAKEFGNPESLQMVRCVQYLFRVKQSEGDDSFLFFLLL